MPYFPPVGGSAFPLNSVGNDVLLDMLAATIKGRALGAGSGDPQDLTGTQLAAILNAAPGPGVLPLLATLVGASSSSLDFTLGDLTKFGGYKIVANDIQAGTDMSALGIRGSTNNGSSYNSGSSDYYAQFIYATTGTVAGAGVTSSYFQATNAMGSAYRYHGLVAFILPNASLGYTNLIALSYVLNNSGNSYAAIAAGTGLGAWNAFRLLMSSGLIARTTALIYGLPK